MLWVDEIVEKIKERYTDKIGQEKPIIIRDEKTASGRVHVGSLRGVAIHGLVSEVLSEKGIKNKYLFEINDTDPMDDIPVYLDQNIYKQYLGKPLHSVPSPDNKAKNFAEYFGGEFAEVIKELGFTPEFYRTSELYNSGAFDETIKIALEKADVIRKIYKEVSGSVREAHWLPINIICEQCGKVSTTEARSFDGEKVEYSCKTTELTEGCGHNGSVSPFGGNAKLPWKVEWAAKFKVLDVDVEGAGKDHSTKGGSRDIADAISRQVFNHEPPLNIPYEFLLVAGKKMSSSKGKGSSSREMADLLPPHLLRLLLLQKDVQRVVDFVPDGDTVPILYDSFDKFAANYFSGNTDDFARLFTLIHFPQERNNIKPRFLPRFSQIAYLVQMPHINVEEEVEKEKGTPLTAEDTAEIELRKEYAKRWLDTYAPEDYRFELQKEVPEQAKNFTDMQKKALKALLDFLTSKDSVTGQDLHLKLHEIKAELNIEPKDFFSAIYLSTLGKTSGPKAGWFLSVLDKEFLKERLQAVTQ
jgi:lysyl-tRNA synthetase class 1